jgi:hypothetical protein
VILIMLFRAPNGHIAPLPTPAPDATPWRQSAMLGILLGLAIFLGCRASPRRGPEPLAWPAWVEDAAVQRGHVQPGDVALFGCPPGWMVVEETAAALRGHAVPTTYVGSGPPPHDGTMTCVAQREFALPAPSAATRPGRAPVSRPLTPVWVSTAGDGITIGFAREVSPSAPIFLGQDTPCGPRLIGVELGDLLKWLSDPTWGPRRNFHGMISSGCPEQNRR